MLKMQLCVNRRQSRNLVNINFLASMKAKVRLYQKYVSISVYTHEMLAFFMYLFFEVPT